MRTNTKSKISNRKQKTEEELRQSAERYRKITQCIPDLVWTMDLSGNFMYANEAVERTHGWTVDEFLNLTLKELVSPQQFARNVARIEEELAKADDPGYDRNIILNYESEELRKDGSNFWAEVTVTPLWSDDGKPIGLIGITRDITERKKAEEILQASEKKFKMLTEKMSDMVWILNTDLRTLYVTPSIQKLLGFTQEERMSQTIEEQLTPDSLSEAQEALAKELALEGHGDPHRTITLVLEYYHKDGSTRWMETTVSAVRNDQGALTALHGVCRDITENKRVNAELQRTLDSLRKAFSTTIQVMVSAIDMRDPYTAGHQRRCADIARAIASEMGLDQEIIDGIRMAGTIHDIGKLSIPAEILTKYTKLTKIEFSLIQEHSLSGYKMLKDVESPWPLAEIVYQHHERIDGSGYPRKLKGDEIIIEARIIGVADVVEAMASHRPYRASLGIDKALEEIEKNKGILYDDAVADACLRLFREKGYQIL